MPASTTPARESYAYGAGFGAGATCEEEAVAQLRSGLADGEELFSAEKMNARVVKKAVVWAHNSHLGHARVTELGEAGEHDLGQLVRERTGEATVLVGVMTHRWHLHDAAEPAFAVRPADLPDERRLEREIGVVYLPQTERVSHYFHAALARQFDAVIHVDETRAVEPLEPSSAWAREVPETYPTGL